MLYSIIQVIEDCLVSFRLPGNGQCSPGKENSRKSGDMSTANGQAVPQGPNSPNGEFSGYNFCSLP